MAIRVVVVYSHATLRQALATGLEMFDDFEVMGTAGDGETGLSLCQQFQPDAVLTEIRLPKLDGVNLIQKVRETNPQTKVIVLDVSLLPEEVDVSLLAGVHKYLPKEISLNELAFSVREVVGQSLTAS